MSILFCFFAIFAKDFGLVCFVSAISSVEFGSMKEKPIIPNSYGRFIKRHYADDKAKYKYTFKVCHGELGAATI